MRNTFKRLLLASLLLTGTIAVTAVPVQAKPKPTPTPVPTCADFEGARSFSTIWGGPLAPTANVKLEIYLVGAPCDNVMYTFTAAGDETKVDAEPDRSVDGNGNHILIFEVSDLADSDNCVGAFVESTGVTKKGVHLTYDRAPDEEYNVVDDPAWYTEQETPDGIIKLGFSCGNSGGWGGWS